MNGYAQPMTFPAGAAIVAGSDQAPYQPFYSAGYGGWFWKDASGYIYGLDKGYSTEEIARHAMNQILDMAREKGARV